MGSGGIKPSVYVGGRFEQCSLKKGVNEGVCSLMCCDQGTHASIVKVRVLEVMFKMCVVCLAVYLTVSTTQMHSVYAQDIEYVKGLLMVVCNPVCLEAFCCVMVQTKKTAAQIQFEHAEVNDM